MKRCRDFSRWDAMEEGDASMLCSLFDKGADVNTVINGWTLFMGASQRGDVDMMQLLVSLRADIDVVNKRGRSALSYATNPSNGSDPHAGAIKFLLESRAYVGKRDLRLLDPLIRVVRGNDVGVQGEVTRVVADFQSLPPWRRAACVAVGGASVGASELRCAVEMNDMFRAERVLMRQANVNEVFRGWTPLMVAAEQHFDDVMELLIRFRAEIDAVNRKGRTALSFALAPSYNGVVRRPRVEAVKLLLKHGADLHRKDVSGCTPCMLAARLGECDARREVWLWCDLWCDGHVADEVDTYLENGR